MLSIRHQGFRAYAAADADPIAGHQFVTRGTDQTGGDDPGDLFDQAWFDQAASRFPDDESGRGPDCQHDDHTGSVLGPVEPVGVTAGGTASPQRECDPKGDRGEGVGEIVDGVGKQGHRAAEDDDHRLQCGGDPKPNQRDLRSPDPVS